MVENTCVQNKKCPFWKKYKENCPNFMETTWTGIKESGIKQIKDCVQKRNLLLQFDILKRLEAVQKVLEQKRNVGYNVLEKLTELKLLEKKNINGKS